MGYSERKCQLCGIPFNIGRIRTEGEPLEAAWTYYIDDYVSQEDLDDPCEADGCDDIDREDGDENEHIAGPDCVSTLGYSGHRISVEEMKDRITVQCLAPKLPRWTPEPDDEDFELEAKFCFVTGISTTGASEFSINNLTPIRHGLENSLINNSTADAHDAHWSLPMHPACFEMFKRMSMAAFGKVDIDGLWLLRETQGSHLDRFENFPRRPDVALVTEQWYHCETGTEYLAANPVRVPGLGELIAGCAFDKERTPDVVFTVTTRAPTSPDPFAKLSPELRLMIIEPLPPSDVAHLRLASPSFTQLPQAYFQRLVKTHMPWLWELEDVTPKRTNWFRLWTALCSADGGLGMDEKERQWLSETRRSLRAKAAASVRQEKGGPWESMPEADRFHAAMDDAAETAKQQIRAAYDSGMWADSKKKTATELKGLRNRRRIYEDLQEILRRIAELKVEGDDGDGE